MINKFAPFVGILAVAGLAFLSSCKDDEETPVAGIQFETEEQEVTESDGTTASFHPEEYEDVGVGRVITAKLLFDIPLAGDVVLQFDLDGSASETTIETENGPELNDYEVVATGENVTIDDDQITIAKGASEAFFSIRVFEDFLPEIGQDFDTNEDGIPYENIEISLESVVSGPGKLGENVEHEIRILEDDAYVYLEWEANSENVDMDLFIHIDGSLIAVLDSDLTNNQIIAELIYIPGGFDNGTYGMSYVYKSGTSDKVDFLVEIANYGGTLTSTSGESGVIYQVEKSYTLKNINNYNPEEPQAQVIQTMVKNGLNYTDVSDITIPDDGSRADSNVKFIPHSQRSIKNLQHTRITVLRPGL